MMDVKRFIQMVKTFASSGLMTPSFAVTVYLPVAQIGLWRESITKELNPHANMQVVIHTYPMNPYLHGPSLNSNMYDHEVVIFVNSKGDRDQFHSNRRERISTDLETLSAVGPSLLTLVLLVVTLPLMDGGVWMAALSG